MCKKNQHVGIASLNFHQMKELKQGCRLSLSNTSS